MKKDYNSLDFYRIKTRPGRSKNSTEIYPDFVVGHSDDLMIRGGKFYAVWDQENGLWTTDEYRVQRIIDKDIHSMLSDMRENADSLLIPKYLSSFSSNSWVQFRSYLTKLPDEYVSLDDKLTFKSQKVEKDDYISKRLPYDLTDGECRAYEELISA
ncbi:MAG: hypothetical protein HUJ62_05555, partial [Streptococcus gallolyticus]|nr:hypothetical protein [Streptococcus gallolyticus]